MYWVKKGAEIVEAQVMMVIPRVKRPKLVRSNCRRNLAKDIEVLVEG
jgi:hypothetical protein